MYLSAHERVFHAVLSTQCFPGSSQSAKVLALKQM
jgi:hypothetical protein